LEVRTGDTSEIVGLLTGSDPLAVAPLLDGGLRGLAVSPGGGQAVCAPTDPVPEALATWLADGAAPKWVHDGKELQPALISEGRALDGVASDTMLAGYLLDPAEANYPLAMLSERYLGLDLAQDEPEDAGQLFADPAPRVGTEAAAIGLLAPAMAERVERAGLESLLAEVELPLSGVLGRMQAAGVALDVPYLQQMSESLGDRMATLERTIYDHAGEPFNLNSPPQLRVVLYEKLRLSPGRKTSKGALST